MSSKLGLAVLLAALGVAGCNTMPDSNRTVDGDSIEPQDCPAGSPCPIDLDHHCTGAVRPDLCDAALPDRIRITGRSSSATLLTWKISKHRMRFKDPGIEFADSGFSCRVVDSWTAVCTVAPGTPSGMHKYSVFLVIDPWVIN
jgi:hypothetical protein